MLRAYVRSFGVTFLVLVLGIGATNLIIDPFGLRGGWRPALGQDDFAIRRDYRLFKLARFARVPSANIILGDSRSDNLREELFEKHGAHYANLAFGGGTAFEAIDAFWFASGHSALKNVVLGVPFNLYSERNDMNLVPAAIAQLRNPEGHYLSLSILALSGSIVASKVRGTGAPTEAPPMSEAAFWDHQLLESAAFYEVWTEPTSLRRRLADVVDYCRTHAINLYFYIPPAHVDLMRRVHDFGLDEQYATYKKELLSFGVPVFDFDVENDFTRGRANFTDPYHLKPEKQRVVVDEMFARGLRH
ncbi:MAG: hypothetical protein V4550_15065 [Gemmatimonadota bacterium]